MKKLRRIKDVTTGSAHKNEFYSDEQLLIQKMQNRIEFLETWLESVLIRDEDQREKDIDKVISELEKQKISLVTYYVLDNYGHRFFSEEVDTQYKIDLASAILNFVKIIYPSYKNELLENISNNNSEYTANYIYVEKV